MPTTPEYQAALDYLFSFVDFSKTHTANLAPENFDLHRMVDLLNRLGNPERDFPCLHIAGTKGKGSTAALCSSALSAGGCRTGLYTSPHLQDFCERIQVDGQPIPQGELVLLVEEIKPQIAQVPGVSTFEITTALAFLFFSRRGVDAAVLEVGLGGRLDATNVVTPLVSVITSISLDHVPILGNTIAEIAAEKAGIIKAGVPVVVAPQVPEALEVILAIAGANGSRAVVVGQDTGYGSLAHDLDGQSLAVWAGTGERQELHIPLLGEPQVANAATAWTALRVAGERGLPVSPEAVAAGMANVVWPGRFEILRQDPYVVLDAAHNPDSAEKLSRTLRDYLPGRRVTLIFGASGDKDVVGFLTAIRPAIDRLIATRSEHPRAMAPEEIVGLAAALALPCTPAPSIESALETAIKDAETDDVILVAGSVFLAGAARDVWPQFEGEI